MSIRDPIGRAFFGFPPLFGTKISDEDDSIRVSVRAVRQFSLDRMDAYHGFSVGPGD
jgi:hypothetical protein